MKIKAKGFTLIELLIALAITSLILGVIYAFFISSSRTLTTTEIKSELQGEAQQIEQLLVKIGTEGKKVKSIVDGTGTTITKYSEVYRVPEDIDNKNKLTLSSLEIEYADGTICLLEYNRATKTLSSQEGSGVKTILSKNVQEFSVRPLDIRMVDLSVEKLFENAPGLEFNITLEKTKGYSDVDYPISTIAKFRNK